MNGKIRLYVIQFAIHKVDNVVRIALNTCLSRRNQVIFEHFALLKKMTI
jgi:hypothetical protein